MPWSLLPFATSPRTQSRFQRRMNASICHGCRGLYRLSNQIGCSHGIIVSWGRLCGRFSPAGILDDNAWTKHMGDLFDPRKSVACLPVLDPPALFFISEIFSEP
jgi:hypothetical protein